ncbi:MAG: hypothetical protein LLF94_11230, partial [Chlamydiales bacterium]|nr:hypothetical protein [Chlamydiales bacterium]
MTTKDTLFALFDSCNITRIVLLLLSYCFITFGQPAYSPLCAAFASTVGFSLFFYEIAKLTTRDRFIYGTLFFFLVQCVQLFWFTYHPVVAARSTFLLLSVLMGLQFGLLCLLVTKKIICSKRLFLLIPAAWTLLEWSRIYWCSGFYFNLTGISLSGNIITLQVASLFGVLGMSFWVMLTNTAMLRAYYLLKKAPVLFAVCIAALPFIYGIFHLQIHGARQTAYDAIHPQMRVLIVHSRKVPEEFLPKPRKRLSPQERSFAAWKELVTAIAPFYNKEKLDLILMPEGVVPYGSTTLLFNTVEINSLFLSTIKKPFALTAESLLTSEDIALEIAKLYKCPLIIGLEGVKRTAT